MAVRRRPPNARSSGLRPHKWFNLAPQPSTASCHQMPLPISAVHHLPPPQSRSGAHAGVSMALRDATPRPSVQQPHLGACWWRQQIPCAAGAGACSRAASLGVSLWSCKNFIVGAGACSRAASLGVSLWSCKIFIVKVRPRSFSGLASPLVRDESSRTTFDMKKR